MDGLKLRRLPRKEDFIDSTGELIDKLREQHSTRLLK